MAAISQRNPAEVGLFVAAIDENVVRLHICVGLCIRIVVYRM